MRLTLPITFSSYERHFQNNLPLGGVVVFVLGDILQIELVMGSL